jgi:hypothetical protein
MGGCTSKKSRDRDLGDEGDEVVFADNPIRELYALFRADFSLDNTEVLLLAAMIKSRRLDKMTAEAQALVVQREATEESLPLDYFIQHISEQSGTDAVIEFRRFNAVVSDCFEAADVQTAIEQMRTLKTQRQIHKYGTSSIRVGVRPEGVAHRVDRSAAVEVRFPPRPLARLYCGPEPDTSEEPTDEVPV